MFPSFHRIHYISTAAINFCLFDTTSTGESKISKLWARANVEHTIKISSFSPRTLFYSPILTHHPLSKTAAFFTNDMFKHIFLNEDIWISLGSNWQYDSIGSDNGLAPSRRQAIILTNADPIHWRIYVALGGDELTIDWGQDKMVTILQTTFSDADPTQMFD